MFHFHHYQVVSTEEVKAEGVYPLTYVDSVCRCGRRRGRYALSEMAGDETRTSLGTHPFPSGHEIWENTDFVQMLNQVSETMSQDQIKASQRNLRFWRHMI